MRAALLASIVLLSPTASALEVTMRGPVVGAGVGMSRAGYTVAFEGGAQTAGLRTLRDGRFLLTWDLAFAARAAELANSEPYLWLYGARASAFVEPVWRIHDRPWSAMVSARIANDATVMIHPGTSLSELHTLNDMDGVGGVTARGAVRVGSGASFLSRYTSVLLQVFVQEWLQAHQANAPGKSFTEVGVSGRVDRFTAVSVAVEGSWGFSPKHEEPALGRTGTTERLRLAGYVRKRFHWGLWVGFAASLQRDRDSFTYEDRTTFHTGDPADFSALFTVGFSP